jgi:hypothetical protein
VGKRDHDTARRGERDHDDARRDLETERPEDEVRVRAGHDEHAGLRATKRASKITRMKRTGSR